MVVGVDGSDAAIRALHWAMVEAERTGARVQAVYIYAMPGEGGWRADATRPTLASSDWSVVLRSAQGELDRAVRRAVGAVPFVALSTLVVPAASPAAGLMKVAATATMLVLGGHQASRIPPKLGSTTTILLDTAPCPVVVVPSSHDRSAELPSGVLVPS